MILEPRTKLRVSSLKKLLEDDKMDINFLAYELGMDRHQVNYRFQAGFTKNEIGTICDLLNCSREDLIK